MSISQDHHNLFRNSDTTDKLNLLQSLLDSKDLTSEQAFALLNIVRTELEQSQRRNSSVYRRYSGVMESLRKQMPEVYEQVVNTWQYRRQDVSSAKSPLHSLMQEPVGAGSGTTLTTESKEVFEEHAKDGNETTD